MPGSDDIRRKRVQDCAGKEIFEIQPLILGGTPTDPGNKAILNRQQHIEAVRYWNNVIREMRKAQESVRGRDSHR
jgi:hypothetical protein